MSMVTITEAPLEDQEPPPARPVVDQSAAVPPSSARARRNTASSIGSVRRPVFVFCCHNGTFLRRSAACPGDDCNSLSPRS
jgi:hypothetical protein